jgi:hypothetical protein
VLEQQGFVVQPTNYGYFDILQFLFPWQPFSRRIFNDITKQIRHTLRINNVTRCSVIAHSFGTFILSRIFRDSADLYFQKIIFCGSVVHYGFPFEEYSHRFEHPLINEVGTRDFWPAIAEAVTVGYGSAGTYGFRRPAVRDRWHNGRSHSDFLNQDFCTRYWVPLMRKGEFVEDDENPEPSPWWLWLLSTLQVKYIIIAIVVMMLLWTWLGPLVPL